MPDFDAMAEAALTRKLLEAARSRDLSQASGVLIEIKSQSQSSLAKMVSSLSDEEAARLKLAEADDELRALKYERARLRRNIDEMTSEITMPDLAATISADEARRVRARAAEPTRDDHQEVLLRLGVERDERARLCAERDALIAQRQKLEAAAGVAAERKAAVDVQLENVVSAAASIKEPIAAHAPTISPLPKELPTPLHILAVGISSYVLGSTPGASLEVVSAEAATAKASTTASKPAAAAKGKQKQPPAAAAAAAAAGDAAAAEPHSLCLCLHLKPAGAKGGKAASVTFRFHPTLEMLTAEAQPPSAEEAVRKLVEADDGSTYPDLSSLLRAKHSELKQSDGGAPPAPPYRAYKWLQWCGGLGPLLESPPIPTQRALLALVTALASALK